MNQVRKAIESMYKGECTVFERKKVTDPVTHVTSFKEVTVHEGVKCKLSFSSATSATTDIATTKKQDIKLFIAPEIDIKPGSKIEVTQNGVTIEYQRSGMPSVLTNHQEIVLELFKGYA